MSNPLVLITGASTGIGLEVARVLLPLNYRLLLTARRSSMDRFKEENIFPSDRVFLRVMDVTSPEERQAVIDEANSQMGGVDILINNAGVSFRAVIEQMTAEDEDTQMSINYHGPMALIRGVLPSMRDKRDGHIINISSVSGMMAMPTMSAYSASKHALEGASESLWYEMRPWGVKVTLVQPGFVRSKGFQRVRLTSASKEALRDSRDPYHQYYVHMTRFVDLMMRYSLSSSEDVAKRVLKTIRAKNPKLRVSGTVDARVFYVLRRLLPRRLYHWMLYLGLPSISRWGPQKRGRGQALVGRREKVEGGAVQINPKT